MNNNILPLILIGALSLLFTSCKSNKATSDETSTARTERSRPNRQGGTPPNFSDLLDQMDANNDLKLSESEVQGPLKEQFSTVDENEDGFITAEEFANMPAPSRQGPPGGGGGRRP